MLFVNFLGAFIYVTVTDFVWFVFVCMYVCISIWICVSFMKMFMYIYLYVYMCMCTNMYACVLCIHVCVCVHLHVNFSHVSTDQLASPELDSGAAAPWSEHQAHSCVWGRGGHQAVYPPAWTGRLPPNWVLLPEEQPLQGKVLLRHPLNQTCSCKKLFLQCGWCYSSGAKHLIDLSILPQMEV